MKHRIEAKLKLKQKDNTCRHDSSLLERNDMNHN